MWKQLTLADLFRFRFRFPGCAWMRVFCLARAYMNAVYVHCIFNVILDFHACAMCRWFIHFFSNSVDVHWIKNRWFGEHVNFLVSIFLHKNSSFSSPFRPGSFPPTPLKSRGGVKKLKKAKRKKEKSPFNIGSEMFSAFGFSRISSAWLSSLKSCHLICFERHNFEPEGWVGS